MNPLIQLKKATPVFLAALVCFGLLPKAQALTPTPDGLYPGANVAEGGSGALFSLTTGSNNTAIGSQTLFSLTTGVQNTAVGAQALKANTNDANTAIGFQALNKNTTGGNNTATGWRALFQNTTGAFNTAQGSQALYSNTTGSFNTANGIGALSSNTDGNFNMANGVGALNNNTTGSYNTANGINALFSNTTGSFNTANGVGALGSNTTSGSNTANGHLALASNTTGGGNTANGVAALFRNTTGRSNIALGFVAGDNLTTGDNNIDIGNEGVAAEANTIRIGTSQSATFIAGISGATVAGTPVIVNNFGQLGVAPSSEQFKDEIKPMGKASEALLSLRPVTFRYKKNIDPKGAPQFGLVTEEVEKVNPDLVVRDAKGKVFTVRYEAVNAMLLNEFLKEHRKNEEQEATMAELKKAIARLAARDEEQVAQIKTVSAQLEASKPAPQVVNNP